MREGLTTPQDLMRHSDEELLSTSGIGSVSLRQVKKQLAVWEQEHRPEEEQSARRHAAPR